MKKLLWIFVGGLLISACEYRNTAEETQKFAGQLVSDSFSLTGDYHWEFQLMGGAQHSVHTFYSDSITYSMDGPVYAIDYTMRKLSYFICALLLLTMPQKMTDWRRFNFGQNN